MTRHLTKHKIPIIAEEMSTAKPMATRKSPPTKDIKQQTIPSTVQKKFVFDQLKGSEEKEDHQWRVVGFFLRKCLPFNTVEKSFRDLPWASEYCSKMDNRTVKRLNDQKYNEVLAWMQQQMEHQVVSVTLDH